MKDKINEPRRHEGHKGKEKERSLRMTRIGANDFLYSLLFAGTKTSFFVSFVPSWFSSL